MNSAEYNWWKNGPGPLNPNFNPDAKELYAKTTTSMERDNFYASHTREECAAEWRRRYNIYSTANKYQKMVDNDINS